MVQQSQTHLNVDNPVDSVINWDVSSAKCKRNKQKQHLWVEVQVQKNAELRHQRNEFKIMTSNITINNTNTFVYGASVDVSFKYNNTHP